MRHLTTATMALLIGIASTTAVAAGGPHYTFIQAAWVDAGIEEGGHDVDGDGIVIDASLAVSEHLFLTAEAAAIELEDDDLTEVAVGIGAHWAVGKATDLVGHVAWLREDLEHHGSSHTEEGWKAFAGARSHLTAAWEVEGGLTWVDLADGEPGVLVGARWYPTPILSVGADLAHNDIATLFELNVRIDF